MGSIVKWVNCGAVGRPEQGYPGDAGYDLYVMTGVEINAGETVDVKHGLAIELPERTWAMIVGRSSTMRNRGLLVNMAIIDNGYRGMLFTSVTNINKGVVKVGRGERISQLILMPLVEMKFVQTTELGRSERGDAGFGSSGR